MRHFQPAPRDTARERRATALALLLLFLSLTTAGLAWSCTDDEPGVVQAPLVEPPGVPPKPNRSNAHVIVNLEAREEIRQIAPGVEYEVWSFNSYVPGPLIRVQVGDTVEVRLRNDANSKVAHNIDLHAVNGPGGGAEATNVAPGEAKAFTFKALAPGLFTYHCAQGIVADHISNGMYGGILVEDARGKSLYDLEYYLGQHEYYVTESAGPRGVQGLDIDKLLAEDATYVVWNGKTTALTGEDALDAQVGDTVRLYMSNGGPNYTSSFHVIGEIFDRVYEWGSLANPATRDVQTVSVPPGGAVIVDIEINTPGDYKIVDHALGRLTKGIVGILRATGDQDFETFRDLQAFPVDREEEAQPPDDGSGAADESRSDAPEVTATPREPAGSAGNGGADAVEVSVEMDDNFFVPDELSVAVGVDVTFNLSNIGRIPHNIHIADENDSYENDAASDVIPGGQTTQLTWAAPDEPGTYLFRCDVHPVEMTGTITVEN